ncbi:unnamed protein product [Protopolystoma xenopodis]|uniref:Uncharacterized protein n=1 Tax=Protopolystoma xenopodis TaxID=117903 RepID=A0A448X7V2_9PLAT|nr:unnamed protein product [Protopolystoma xenopodis]
MYPGFQQTLHSEPGRRKLALVTACYVTDFDFSIQMAGATSNENQNAALALAYKNGDVEGGTIQLHNTESTTWDLIQARSKEII